MYPILAIAFFFLHHNLFTRFPEQWQYNFVYASYLKSDKEERNDYD